MMGLVFQCEVYTLRGIPEPQSAYSDPLSAR